MKTKEEPKAIKEVPDCQKEKLSAMTEDELVQAVGGITVPTYHIEPWIKDIIVGIKDGASKISEDNSSSTGNGYGIHIIIEH